MERLLIVSAAALVVVLAVRGGQQTQTAMQQTDFTPDVSTQTIADASPDVEVTSTVCWYEDGEGYLVPVTRQIPLQDGVAKATLSLMVKSSENDLAAARMGLRNVIPEGVTFDLDISGGKARVDLSKEALSCQNAEEELLMVQGTAAALCGFDSVQEVTFLSDGQKRSQLTHGTDVSGVFKADGVNLESVETTANLTNASRVQLYFPSADGRLMVPVTRTVFSPADLTTAMLELAKGPEKDSGLEIPLPKDCGLRSVTLKNGVATIDFTKRICVPCDGGGRERGDKPGAPGNCVHGEPISGREESRGAGGRKAVRGTAVGSNDVRESGGRSDGTVSGVDYGGLRHHRTTRRRVWRCLFRHLRHANFSIYRQ